MTTAIALSENLKRLSGSKDKLFRGFFPLQRRFQFFDLMDLSFWKAFSKRSSICNLFFCSPSRASSNKTIFGLMVEMSNVKLFPRFLKSKNFFSLRLANEKNAGSILMSSFWPRYLFTNLKMDFEIEKLSKKI